MKRISSYYLTLSLVLESFMKRISSYYLTLSLVLESFMKRISFVLLTLFFGGISHSVHAIPLELHGLRPFPNIFIQFSDQIEEGEENVASLEEVRAREEEVILRYSKDPSGQSTSKYSDDTSTTQSALKYPNEGSSVMAQSELKYSHDDPSIVAEPTLKYPHNLTQMLLKIPVVVVQPKLKYPHDDPSVVTQPALKYPHDDPSVVVQPALKYPHDDPSVVVQPALKYPHDDPSVVVQPALKYPHDDPSVVVQPALKYPHDDPSVVTQPALKYPHDDPSVVTQPELKYPHNLTQMLLKIPVVVVRPELKYPYDDPSVVAQPELKYSHDDPSVAAQTALRYSQAAAKYPPASRSPLIEWNDPDFLNILYKKEVHLYEWDEKTRDSWIQKIDEHLQKDICLDLGDDCLETFQVGSLPNAKFAVIFVHGAIDYKKHLGVNDIGFGGNFNFLKNLVLRNEGVYFSPVFSFIAVRLN